MFVVFHFLFQAEDGIRDGHVTGVQTCALPICRWLGTLGTSVRESVDIIRAQGAEPAAVLIALDRMERAGADTQVETHSAEVGRASCRERVKITEEAEVGEGQSTRGQCSATVKE